MRGRHWLNVAALVTWLICGLPHIVTLVQGDFAGWPAVLWVAAFLLYGAALIPFLGLAPLVPLRGYIPLVLLVVQMVAAVTVVMLPVMTGHGPNSTPALLVVIAAELPYLASGAERTPSHVTLPAAWIWAVLALLVLVNTGILFAIARSWSDALSYGISMGGFMLFAAASSFLVRSEAAARDQLAVANTELLGTRALLAESSRAEERLRISRNLHDTLGHHLTALVLQLDVATRLSDGKAADHLRQSQAIARLLLADVRDVVSRLREGGHFDVVPAIREIAAGQTSVAIHLDLPESLPVVDGPRAETLLRSVQEIITNTVRHAHAQNLWIRLESRAAGLALHARDDGRGADVVTCGNGLTGMRERFELCDGRVEFTAGRSGFEVRGFLPAAAA